MKGTKPIEERKEAVMALEKELKYFENQKAELLKHHENQFVLISGDQLAGAFTTEAEAYQAGLQKFGNQPFLMTYFPRVRERISLEFPCGASGIVVGFGDTQKTQDVALKCRKLRGKADR